MPRKSSPDRTASAPSVDDVAAVLMRWSALAMHAARAEGMPAMLRTLHEHNLSMPMVVVLHLLAFEGPQPMTRLAERTGLSTSATSHLLQRLVEAGLVGRAEVEVDRRVRQIALTPAGDAVIQEMVRQRFADLRASVQPLTPATRARLSEALTAVIDELGAAIGPAARAVAGAQTDPVAPPSASKTGRTKTSRTPRQTRSREQA